MATPAGWYDDGSGRQRWWDGSQWTDSYQDSAQQSETEEPVLSFVSKVIEDDTTVQVFTDRMEWAKKTGGVSAKKVTAGIFTAGLSLAATGLGKGSYGAKKITDLSIIQLDSVTGIASLRDGKRTTVTVSTPSMALPLNLPKKEAEQVAKTLNSLVSAAKQAPSRPTVVVQQAAPTAAAPAPAAAPAVDPTLQLQKLAELHQQGVLNDDEFASAKAKALGI